MTESVAGEHQLGDHDGKGYYYGGLSAAADGPRSGGHLWVRFNHVAQLSPAVREQRVMNPTAAPLVQADEAMVTTADKARRLSGFSDTTDRTRGLPTEEEAPAVARLFRHLVAEGTLQAPPDDRTSTSPLSYFWTGKPGDRFAPCTSLENGYTVQVPKEAEARLVVVRGTRPKNHGM